MARTIGLLVISWWALAGLHHALNGFARTPSLIERFPMPQFSGWSLHPTGLPYVIAFLALLAVTLRYADRLSSVQVVVASIAMIALGNLGQGGFHAAYIAPFEGTRVQYFHDALRIATPWREWLANFNRDQ